ncbi:DUF3618 domain-containing protein [Gordonia sp. TBRC 11910]|uniref:DUF3618 domain-containing protein n=1 Tax=Gordonia asplenii TaxID=2725283 RepID=A0A848KZD8_9ACTN|nr:DUF3618 domain-containing protein [Gordonia asplenii]NMO03759.1 DUF3618 domain-containing protein [Gordonia asplenii]
MGGETERIEQDIARAREDLANTLDALAERANPQRLADDAKAKVLVTLNQPVVKFGIAGAGVLVVALVVRKVLK